MLAETFAPAIASITTTGVVSTYTEGLSAEVPRSIAPGPDGNLWFTDADDAIGRITPAGVITVFQAGVSPNGMPDEITAGTDGQMWFTEREGGRIGRISPSTGAITEFSAGIAAGARPSGIAAGLDGNMWFTEPGAQRIARITTAGVVTEYAEGMSADSSPQSIAPAPDGTLWFADASARVGRATILAPPLVTTSAGSGIGATTATLHGTVDPQEASTSAHFEYGTTTAYGTSTAEQTFEGSGATPASASLTGLQPGTMHYFRLVATSSHGRAESTGTFTTPQAPPPPDTTPPSTTIDSGPADPTGATSWPASPLAPLVAPAPLVVGPVVPAAGRLSLVVAARSTIRDGRVRVGCRLDAGALASCLVTGDTPATCASGPR